MMRSRAAGFGLLAFLVFIPGFFATDAGAAQPSSSFNNRSSAEDENFDSVQGEIERVITPEYRQRGMRVERTSDRNLRVLMPSEVMFAVDSADISRDFAPTLRQVARIMSDRPRMRARIIGHTDSDGSDSHNMDLSLRRAESVADFIGGQGVERRRLRTEGRGEQEPIASNATPQGRQQNRRVELILMRPQRGDRARRNQP